MNPFAVTSLKYAFILFPALAPIGTVAETRTADRFIVPEPIDAESGYIQRDSLLISDREALFMGIDPEEFVYWVGGNTVYPETAYEAERWGDVTVEFFVEPDGTLSSIKVMESSDASFSEAVTETIEKSPLWKPAMQDGKPIRSRVEINVPFLFTGEISYMDASGETGESVKPKFEGCGLEAFRKWVNQQVIYPESAVRNDIEGTVVASFVVSSKGDVRNIRIIRSPNYALAAEVVRVLKSSPLWEPARRDGKPVSYMFTLPVIFTFHN